MATATIHPNRQLISSEDVHGTEVYGADRKHIGEIDHLMIDKASGRVGYAVISPVAGFPSGRWFAGNGVACLCVALAYLGATRTG